MRIHALLLALALPVFPGCVLDFDFDDWDTAGSGESLVVDDAYVEGDLGDVQGVSSEARVANAYESYGYVNIELRAQGRGWAVMHMLDLETDELQVGDRYDSQDHATPYVGLVGCSGPEDNTWDFDRSADRVVVEVEEGSTPDKLRVQYRAEYSTYDGETQYASGSLEIERF